MEAGLSLGSNLEDRLLHLREARTRIAGIPGVRLTASAPVYETEPVDVPEAFCNQPFLNTVLLVDTRLAPVELGQALNAIETALGRIRPAVRNAPRTIDIDLLYLGDSVLQNDDWQIPHPRWAQRRFVAAPLADLRPTLVLPGQTRTVQEVLLSLPDRPKVIPYLQRW